MPETKHQTKRYTDQELSLIKAIFLDNESILKVIRKAMLQLPLNAVDQSIISLNITGKKGVLAILRKTFLPEIDPEAPLNQVIDLWMTVNITDKTPEEAYPHLIARSKLIEYIDQQLTYLETGKEGKIKFNSFLGIDNKDPEDAYSDLVARNTMISHTEQQLSGLEILANLPIETTEEAKDRLKKDSSK